MFLLNVWSEAVFSWGVVLLSWMAEVEKSVKLNVIVIIIEPEICSAKLTRISEEH